MRKIKVPTDTPPEFELGNTVADIQRRRKRERQEKGRKRHRNKGRKPTQQRREWQKSMQGQTEVTQKWIQRLEERLAHVNRSQDTRRGTSYPYSG